MNTIPLLPLQCILYVLSCHIYISHAQNPCESFIDTDPNNLGEPCEAPPGTDQNSFTTACLDSNGYFCTPPAGILYSDEEYKEWVGQQLVELYNLTDGTHTEELESPNFFINGPKSESRANSQSQCNCYNMPITWAAEHLPLNNEQTFAFIQFIRGKDFSTFTKQWDPAKNGSPCDSVTLAYTWEVTPSNSPMDPIVLSIPPGNAVSTIIFGNPVNEQEADSSSFGPCGVVSNDPYQSINDGGGTHPFLRPSTMPISNYCQENQIDSEFSFIDNINRFESTNPKNLNSAYDGEFNNLKTPPNAMHEFWKYSPTKRIYFLTLLRYWGVIDMTCTCRMGAAAALMTFAGLFADTSRCGDSPGNNKATRDYVQDTFNYYPSVCDTNIDTTEDPLKRMLCNIDWVLQWAIMWLQDFDDGASYKNASQIDTWVKILEFETSFKTKYIATYQKHKKSPQDFPWLPTRYTEVYTDSTLQCGERSFSKRAANIKAAPPVPPTPAPTGPCNVLRDNIEETNSFWADHIAKYNKIVNYGFDAYITKIFEVATYWPVVSAIGNMDLQSVEPGDDLGDNAIHLMPCVKCAHCFHSSGCQAGDMCCTGCSRLAGFKSQENPETVYQNTNGFCNYSQIITKVSDMCNDGCSIQWDIMTGGTCNCFTFYCAPGPAPAPTTPSPTPAPIQISEYWNDVFTYTEKNSANVEQPIISNGTDIDNKYHAMAPLGETSTRIGYITPMQSANGQFWIHDLNQNSVEEGFEFFKNAGPNGFIPNGNMDYYTPQQIQDKFYKFSSFKTADENLFNDEFLDTSEKGISFVAALLNVYNNGINPCFFTKQLWKGQNVFSVDFEDYLDKYNGCVDVTNDEYKKTFSKQSLLKTLKVENIQDTDSTIQYINGMDLSKSTFTTATNNIFSAIRAFLERPECLGQDDGWNNCPYFNVNNNEEYVGKNDPLGNGGLFLHSPVFAIKSNDNTRTPQNHFHTPKYNAVKVSFPTTNLATLPNLQGRSCWKSNTGTYNDWTGNNGNPPIEKTASGYCYYWYSAVYGNTRLEYIAQAGAVNSADYDSTMDAFSIFIDIPGKNPYRGFNKQVVGRNGVCTEVIRKGSDNGDMDMEYRMVLCICTAGIGAYPCNFNPEMPSCYGNSQETNVTSACLGETIIAIGNEELIQGLETPYEFGTTEGQPVTQTRLLSSSKASTVNKGCTRGTSGQYINIHSRMCVSEIPVGKLSSLYIDTALAGGFCCHCKHGTYGHYAILGSFTDTGPYICTDFPSDFGSDYHVNCSSAQPSTIGTEINKKEQGFTVKVAFYNNKPYAYPPKTPILAIMAPGTTCGNINSVLQSNTAIVRTSVNDVTGKVEDTFTFGDNDDFVPRKVPRDFDPLHCALVETPGFVTSDAAPQTTHTDETLPVLKKRITEKPMFLDPSSATCGENVNQPVGLTMEQLNTWCGCETDPIKCGGEDIMNGNVRYHMCTYNYTTGMCVIRDKLHTYSTHNDRLAPDSSVVVGDPQCYKWNAELHPSWMCQRQDAFTGCVLIESHLLRTTESMSQTTAPNKNATGASIDIPNTMENLAVVPKRGNPNRNYALMTTFKAACVYKGTYPRYKPKKPNSTKEVPYECNPNGATCTCDYVNDVGHRVTKIVEFTNNVESINQDVGIFSHIFSLENTSEMVKVTVSTTASGQHISALAMSCKCSKTTDGFYDINFIPNMDNQKLTFFIGDGGNGVIRTTPNTVIGSQYKTSRTCVPLNFKIKLDKSNYETLYAKGRVYKTSPVDCEELAAAPNAADSLEYKQNCAFRYVFPNSKKPTLQYMHTGITPPQTPSIQYVNTDTNVPQSTSWYHVMRSYGYGAYFFKNNGNPVPIVPGSGMCKYASVMDSPNETCHPLTLLNGNPSTDESTNTLPYRLDKFNNDMSFCESSGQCSTSEYRMPDCDGIGNGADCVIAVDKTFLNPCAPLYSNTWYECQKPTMQYLFPLYNKYNPQVGTTPMYYPSEAWKSPTWKPGDRAINPNTEKIGEAMYETTWRQYYWTQYLTFVHYCDTYLDAPVYCEDDILSKEQRLEFCETYKAQYVYTGLSLVEFSIQDICPFTQDPNLPKTCFVFPDSTFGNIASILSVKNYDWSNTVFYLVPFSIKIVKKILIDASFSDVLITNHVSSTTLQYMTAENINELGKNGMLLGNPIVKNVVTGEDHTNIGAICQRNIPMTLKTIQLLDKIITTMGEATGGETFAFASLESNHTMDPMMSMSRAEVYREYSELNVKIQFDGITIMPALKNYPITYSGITNAAAIRGLLGCTRFNVDAKRFTIKGHIIFKQTGCENVPQLRRTPLIFSGAFAQTALIENITAVDSEIMVSVLGADTTQFTYQPLIDASALVVSNINFEYTNNDAIPLENRNVYSAFARAVGDVTVTQCDSTIITPPEASKLINCVIAFNDPGEECLRPGSCIPTANVNTTVNNPCCKGVDPLTVEQNVVWPVVYNPIYCPKYGWQCSYPTETIVEVLSIDQTPNNLILCNEPYCNCYLYKECITLLERGNLFEQSYFQCSYAKVNITNYNAQDDASLSVMDLKSDYIQSWQYNINGPNYGGSIRNYDEGILGVGFQTRWWTISLDNIINTSSPEGWPLVQQEYTFINSSRMYIAPTSTADDSLTEFGDNVRISLKVDQFDFTGIGSTQFNNKYPGKTEFIKQLGGLDTWCVNVNIHTNRLELTRCKNPETGVFYTNITLFYIDTNDYNVHVASKPFMCITSRNTYPTTLIMEPCMPCTIGSQMHIPCSNNELLESNQWFYTPEITIEYGIVKLYLLSIKTGESYTIKFIGIENSYQSYNTPYASLVFSEPGMCITERINPINNTVDIIEAPCNSCIWEHLNIRRTITTSSKNAKICQDAIGPEKLICSKDQSSGLYGVTNGETVCTTPELSTYISSDAGVFRAHGAHYGIGALVKCVDYYLTIVKRGYGYFTFEKVEFYTLDNVEIKEINELNVFHAETKKVVIQPYNATSFNVNARGVEVVNISAFTAIFGQAVEENIFSYDANYGPTLIAINIVFAIVNLFCIVLHIALVFSTTSLRDEVAEEIIAKKGGDAMQSNDEAEQNTQIIEIQQEINQAEKIDTH